MDYLKLVAFYRKYNFVSSGLTDEELIAYFMNLHYRGNVIVEHDANGEVIGFIELWRINYEQLGRIMVHGFIDAREEDTSNGNICFLANLAIHPDYRSGPVGNILRNRFFKENYGCKFFCGDSRRRKHHHTFNIYKRNEIMDKYLTEGANYGNR